MPRRTGLGAPPIRKTQAASKLMHPFIKLNGGFIAQGDALTILRQIPDESIQCVVTSPPYYGLRDYGMDEQIGREPTVKEYIDNMLGVFAEVKRVLKKDGTCFVNLGDSYAGTGSKGDWKDPKYPDGRNGHSVSITANVAGIAKKSLMNVPARFAIGMTDELGWVQRNEIIWHKPAVMPSSVKDRFTVDFEKVLFFSKSQKYKFHQQREPHVSYEDTAKRTKLHNKGTKYAARSDMNDGQRSRLDYFHPDGRNMRTTWSVNFEPQKEKHYASYPSKLIEPMIFAGTDAGDVVLDMFAGTGTTLVTAIKHGRKGVGIELNPDYVDIIAGRLGRQALAAAA
jgi:DNA modification methylase